MTYNCLTQVKFLCLPLHIIHSSCQLIEWCFTVLLPFLILWCTKLRQTCVKAKIQSIFKKVKLIYWRIVTMTQTYGPVDANLPLHWIHCSCPWNDASPPSYNAYWNYFLIQPTMDKKQTMAKPQFTNLFQTN